MTSEYPLSLFGLFGWSVVGHGIWKDRGEGKGVVRVVPSGRVEIKTWRDVYVILSYIRVTLI